MLRENRDSSTLIVTIDNDKQEQEPNQDQDIVDLAYLTSVSTDSLPNQQTTIEQINRLSNNPNEIPQKWSEKGYEIDKTEGYKVGYRTGRGGKESRPTLKDENIYITIGINKVMKMNMYEDIMTGGERLVQLVIILTLHGNG